MALAPFDPGSNEDRAQGLGRDIGVGALAGLGAAVLGVGLENLAPGGPIAGIGGILLIVVAASAATLAARYRRLVRRLKRQRLEEAGRLEAALREQLGILDEGLGFMVLFRGPEYRYVYANKTYHRLIEKTEIVGRTLQEVRPQATPRVVELMEQVRLTGQALQEREIPAVVGPDETRYFDYSFQPLPATDREPAGVFVEGHEVTEAVRARLALEESEARLRMATESGGVGVWEWRLDTNEMIYSREAREISGFPIDGPVTYQMVEAVTHPEDLPNTLAQARRALDPKVRDGAPYEYRIVRPSGELRWVYATGRAVFEMRDGQETPLRYLGTILDITERKLSEERLQLLSREVDHRANNLMSVVQGTVALSRADTVEELRETIQGRVQALARAHQLLASTRWQGADLRQLVEDEVAAFAPKEGARVSIDGECRSLTPDGAQAVAMVLHELATNAVKHGALGAGGGRVEIAWGVEGGDLLLSWTETGGPLVTPPKRAGFGSTVLKRALEGRLNGSTVLDWRPEGLSCALRMPLDDGGQAAADPPPEKELATA